MFTPEGKLRDGGVKFLKKARSGVRIINFTSSSFLVVGCLICLYLHDVDLCCLLVVQGIDPSIRAEVWPFLLGL